MLLMFHLGYKTNVVRLGQCAFSCYTFMNRLSTVDWIQKVPDRVQWPAAVNMLMNLRYFIKVGEFLEHLSDY
jgi:hypothetical protein